MDLKFFCPRWGSEHIAWDDFMLKAKNAGYDGIEYGIANDAAVTEVEIVFELAAEHKLLMIPQHYGTYESDFNKHYDEYAAWLQKLEPFKAIKLNSQTGKDFFSFEQNKALIDLAQSFADRTGTAVYHETHRNKFSFAAHITKTYLECLPYLMLTLDASHWVNVAESYLTDQPEAMQLAIERTGHVHARVGYPEGSQIPDPRAPEWTAAVEIHLAWWDRVIKNLSAQNEPITITPEFGPYPYMVHLPYNKGPIADQWAVNVYMMDLIRSKY